MHECAPEHSSLGHIEDPVNRGQSLILIPDGEEAVVHPGNALLKVIGSHAGRAAGITAIKKGLA